MDNYRLVIYKDAQRQTMYFYSMADGINYIRQLQPTLLPGDYVELYYIDKRWGDRLIEYIGGEINAKAASNS